MTKLEYIYLRANKLNYISKELSKVKELSIYTDSYANLNNLSGECEYLQINGLKQPLKNLPVTIKEIRLYEPIIKDIKIPYGCSLYIDNIKIIN